MIASSTRSCAPGEPLYAIDREALQALAPDLVIAQVHCDVCAVSPAQLDAAHGWPALRGFTTVSMRGGSLEGILQDFATVASAIGCEAAGAGLIAGIRRELGQWRDRLATTRRPSVVCLEWTDPIFPMGNWGPELVEYAGGLVPAGKRERALRRHALERGRGDRPRRPGGGPLRLRAGARARRDAGSRRHAPGWDALQAVRRGQVYVADGNRYFNRSGPTVFDSVGVLAEILHPGIAGRPSEGSVYRRWEPRAAP